MQRHDVIECVVQEATSTGYLVLVGDTPTAMICSEKLSPGARVSAQVTDLDAEGTTLDYVLTLSPESKRDWQTIMFCTYILLWIIFILGLFVVVGEIELVQAGPVVSQFIGAGAVALSTVFLFFTYWTNARFEGIGKAH